MSLENHVERFESENGSNAASPTHTRCTRYTFECVELFFGAAHKVRFPPGLHSIVDDVIKRYLRSAVIDGRQVSLWVIIRRADLDCRDWSSPNTCRA